LEFSPSSYGNALREGGPPPTNALPPGRDIPARQLNAPHGNFAHSLIVASTNAIKADDSTYLWRERRIQQLTSQRDEIVQRLKDLLEGSGDGHHEHLIRDGHNLLEAAQDLAGL
jgi:hypothetical protein